MTVELAYRDVATMQEITASLYSSDKLGLIFIVSCVDISLSMAITMVLNDISFVTRTHFSRWTIALIRWILISLAFLCEEKVSSQYKSLSTITLNTNLPDTQITNCHKNRHQNHLTGGNWYAMRSFARFFQLIAKFLCILEARLLQHGIA